MRRWLLDTGPLVAYLDRSDPAHEFVSSRLDLITGECCTTAAVITEAMYFLSSNRRAPALLLEFLISARVNVYECTGFAEIAEAVTLMEKYADQPMDFADATLVVLAGTLKTVDICTLDRRGFSTYRTARGKPFHLLLDSP